MSLLSLLKKNIQTQNFWTIVSFLMDILLINWKSIPNTSKRTWWPEPDYMYQKCLCEYKVILSMYSEGANEKCRAHTVWHDLKAGRSLQATFFNTVIQLCPAMSLQLGRPWIITLPILSMGEKKKILTPCSQTALRKKKKHSVGTAAGQDWEDFEGQNMRIIH